MKTMIALCPRCRGNNITNDLCIICGAYVAPEETLVFVRSGNEPLPPGRPAGKRNEDEDRETAILARRIAHQSYYAIHRNDEGFLARRRAQERARYARMKNDPAFMERNRQKYREWAYRKKLEREAARVASA